MRVQIVHQRKCTNSPRYCRSWKEYDFDDIPPDFKQELIKRQWKFPRVVELVSLMTWRIIESVAGNSFLTSDNPVHYFGWMGLTHRVVEVSVSLCLNINRRLPTSLSRKAFICLRLTSVHPIHLRVLYSAARKMPHRQEIISIVLSP